nr:reverse transcriptase domain-containing protein [Tanacetum cinerariifolium]
FRGQGGLVEDLVNYHLNELRCSAQCHTNKSMWINSRGDRFVHPPLARTPRCSEAYLCWRSAPLSTMYPPTTFESLAGDSSFKSSVGPSRKRCRSPAASMTLSIHSTRALVPSHADLLPHHRDVEAGIDIVIGMKVDVGIDVEDEVEDEVESSDRGTMEVGVDIDARIDIPGEIPLQRMEDTETTQRQLEAGQLIAIRERELNMTITRSGMTLEAIEELVNQGVEEALAAYEAARAANALEAENQSQNGSDGDNGNEENGMAKTKMEKMEMDFMKCQPLNFKGTEGVVRLTRWFEKMKTVFHISNCPKKYQANYATCTLLNSALTWWNLHKRTVGTDVAFTMSWRELMKLMDEVYCPRNKVQKMESELWNLTVKNNDLAAYT